MLHQQRGVYLQQNNQLAKYNSSLLVRISDLENKISELMQENVLLRSRLSVTSLKSKEKITHTLQILENGILGRLEDVKQLFCDLRRQEGLEISGEARSSTEIRSPNLSSKRTIPLETIPVCKSLENENIEQPKNDGIELDEDEIKNMSKKRRKSSRRESLFMLADFEFNNEELEEELQNVISHRKENEVGGGLTHVPNDNVKNKLLDEEEEQNTEERGLEGDIQIGDEDSPSEITVPPVHTEREATLSNRSDIADDDSYNFTTSVIEYSIPEETGDLSRSCLDTSKLKVDVYNDNEDSNKDPEEALNFVQYPIASQSKVKHSMKPPRAKQRGGADDVMPSLDYDSSEKRTRRTRGKPVNYKLPSLRAKMRRPSEKLVDATTVTDIHDLQVRGKNTSQHEIALQNKPINTGTITAKLDDSRVLKDLTPSFHSQNQLINKIATCSEDSKDHKRETTIAVPITSDLTAFDIIDGISLKHIPKTHRVKAREDVNKKRRRIHAEELST